LLLRKYNKLAIKYKEIAGKESTEQPKTEAEALKVISTLEEEIKKHETETKKGQDPVNEVINKVKEVHKITLSEEIGKMYLSKTKGDLKEVLEYLENPGKVKLHLECEGKTYEAEIDVMSKGNDLMSLIVSKLDDYKGQLVLIKIGSTSADTLDSSIINNKWLLELGVYREESIHIELL